MFCEVIRNETSNLSSWRLNEALLGAAFESICRRDEIVLILRFIIDNLSISCDLAWRLQYLLQAPQTALLKTQPFAMS